jgi:hypothetical protein
LHLAYENDFYFFLFISPLSREFWTSSCSISMAEYAAFVIGVVQLGAEWTATAPSSQKNLRRDQHAERRGNEIDPKRVPVTGAKC